MGEWVLRAGRIVLGVGCLALGVVGLFLPFLQGILFLVIGLTLLSSESEWARHILDWVKRKSRRQTALESPDKTEYDGGGSEGQTG